MTDKDIDGAGIQTNVGRRNLSSTSKAQKATLSSDLPAMAPNTQEWKKAIRYLKNDGNLQDIKKSFQISASNEKALLEEAAIAF